jgi:hypothetical protein
MRPWIGTALLWLGALTGVLAVALFVFGLPATLPPALVALIAGKLAAAAAIGLLAVGAVVRRSAGHRAGDRLPPPRPPRSLPPRA